MTADQKKRIAWWAAQIVEQTEEYAEHLDPNRTRRNRTAFALDSINAQARKLYFDLTGKAPGGAA